MVRYVIIPSDLARELHEPLRRHYKEDPSVRVIVERRAPDAAPPKRAGTGARRRVGDHGSVPARRVAVSAPAPGALPKEAIPYAQQLRFLRAIDAEAPDVADHESLRLVARFQQGDHGAFDDLYRRHFESVYGYLRMSLRSADLAEDVAQLVFMRALQALPRYRFQPDVPFWSWLRRIARNEVLRALRPRGVSIEPWDPSELDRAGGSLAEWESERALIALAEQLPPRQQQVFMLRYGIGLSITETGTVISASEDAVKSLGKRALAQVRQEMREQGYAPSETSTRPLAMRRLALPSPVLAHRRTALSPRVPM